MKKKEVSEVRTKQETKKNLYMIIDGWRVKTLDQLAQETGLEEDKVRAWAYRVKAQMRKVGMEPDNYLPQKKGKWGVVGMAVDEVVQELKFKEKKK